MLIISIQQIRWTNILTWKLVGMDFTKKKLKLGVAVLAAPFIKHNQYITHKFKDELI